MEVPFVTAEGCLDGNCLAKGLSQKCDSPFCIYEKREIRKDRKNPELLFTHNYVRQGFYSPVAIRKLAVTEFYPVFWSCGTPQARAPSSNSPRYPLHEEFTDKTFNSQ